MCVPLFSLVYRSPVNKYTQADTFVAAQTSMYGLVGMPYQRMACVYVWIVENKFKYEYEAKKINSLNVYFFANPYSARNSGLHTYTHAASFSFYSFLKNVVRFMSVSPHWHINAANRFFFVNRFIFFRSFSALKLTTKNIAGDFSWF